MTKWTQKKCKKCKRLFWTQRPKRNKYCNSCFTPYLGGYKQPQYNHKSGKQWNK